MLQPIPQRSIVSHEFGWGTKSRPAWTSALDEVRKNLPKVAKAPSGHIHFPTGAHPVYLLHKFLHTFWIQSTASLPPNYFLFGETGCNWSETCIGGFMAADW